MSSVPIHGRSHRPGGPDPIHMPPPGGQSPWGIYGSGSMGMPDPDAPGFLSWPNANFGVVAEGSNGTAVTVSAAAYTDEVFSSDRDTYPEVFAFIEAPGVYLAAMHVLFSTEGDPGPGAEVNNYLEWNPGGYVAGGGGAGYPDKQHEFHDVTGVPISYRGVVQWIHRESVLYVPPSVTPAPCNRFRAWSDFGGYSAITVGAAVWRIGDWAG